MARLFLIAFVWAWPGLVSCEDEDRVKAAVRTAGGDPPADIECQEPPARHSEKNWAGKTFVRGAARCFEVHDLDEAKTWEVECRKVDPNEGKIVLP